MHYAATGSLVYFGPNFGLSRMQNTRGQYCTDLLPFCFGVDWMSVRGCTSCCSQFYCTVAKNKPCCGAVIPSPWAACTPPVGGMPHVQVRHQEPRAREQRAGHAAGCCKTRCVWACGTPRGPSNVLPVPLPCVVHVLPAANTRRRNKTTLDLSNASKNRLKSGVSYATQHALFNGSVCFPIDCKFCSLGARTNAKKANLH